MLFPKISRPTAVPTNIESSNLPIMLLKEFIDEAKQQEWFDNTIFVFVGDHGKIVGTPRSDMPLSFNHVPLFIYSPSFIEPLQIEDLGGQVDIAPTVLGLLNIDYTDNGFG